MFPAQLVHHDLRIMSEADFIAGYSALCCPHCGQMITKMQEQHILTYGNYSRCQVCRKTFWIESVNPMVEPGSAHLVDSQNAKTQTWYHATYHKDWMSALLSDEQRIPLVHIGTKEAAYARAETENYQYVYSMTIVPSADIFDKVVRDDNYWAEYVGDTESAYPMPADGLLYLNVWESPGSISMLVDPRALEVIEVTNVNHMRSLQVA